MVGGTVCYRGGIIGRRKAGHLLTARFPKVGSPLMSLIATE